MPSPFTLLPSTAHVASNALAYAIRDRYPVTPGHTLVIPRREVPTWFEATREEQLAILDLLAEVKRQLDAELQPAGYNVGFNAGLAAGQTVLHFHLHVIPRHPGDMDDPRGGVRHVIPSKGNYLLPEARPLATGGLDDPFQAHLGPLWDGASDVAIIAAFVQLAGLDALREPLFAALARGARVRLVTGDYLAITQVSALEQLVDWMALHAGRLDVRVVETAGLAGRSKSFHPKAWRFEGDRLAVAFVGSSNISQAALGSGIEWNLRLERGRDPAAWAALVQAFEGWWGRARPLEAAWVSAYALRARQDPQALPPGEDDAAPILPPPPPHALQVKALEALRAARDAGRTRSLVVLATGLGKTLLAALDVASLADASGKPPRTLVLAHREELLEQAATTFRRVFRERYPGLQIGWCVGDRSDLDGDLVLASVQKLSRAEHRIRLSAGQFEYVIIDEVHHAAAKSYRDVLDRLQPRYLLGLTATPERADGGDVLGLVDDHVAYRADLGVGIAARLLVPFAYWGLKDDVDYANVPWRNRQFDPAELAKAVATDRRMAQLWEAWGAHPGTRTLVFCCSVAHATFARDWLRAKGVRVEAVHSGAGSYDRDEGLTRLADGRLEALCAVDLFNEGVDVPGIDRVVMLRPTESSVVFLQQLGRGLRVAPGKARVEVIDFVGNHRMFLDRVRTLISLGGGRGDVRAYVATGEAELPPGCSVDVSVEAKELLARLLPNGASEVERAFRDRWEARGDRPTIGEQYRAGLLPSTLRREYGGWFGFLHALGALTADERAVRAEAEAWFEELETTPLTKCFKLVTLEALLEADALREGLGLAELARRSHAILARTPAFFADLQGVKELPDPAHPDPAKWQRYWQTNPVAAWTGGRWFVKDGERFVPRLPIPEGKDETFAAMTRELVDYRLAQYRARQVRAGAGPGAFEAKLSWNQRDPILKLPTFEGRPVSDIDVVLPDGARWVFGFRKEFCNVARPVGASKNALPDLLRQWFGPTAGRPGTASHVRFTREGEAWHVAPVGAEVVPFPTRGRILAFPTLKAAAGAIGPGQDAGQEASPVKLPVRASGDDLFAVRVAGDSMDGGPSPLRDGDWAVLRWARGEGLGAFDGRVALVQAPDPHGAFAWQLKRIVRGEEGWVLRSDNPARPSFQATAETVPVARLVESVPPERLAPAPGRVFDTAQALGAAFGLEGVALSKNGRYEGLLVLVVDGEGPWRAPEFVPRPGETAFVVRREAGGWRYVGIARWREEIAGWVG